MDNKSKLPNLVEVTELFDVEKMQEKYPQEEDLRFPMNKEDLLSLHREGFGGGSTGFGGRLNADGTAVSLPSGWTPTKTGTGQYTITHNLGHTDYVVMLAGLQTGAWVDATLAELNANDFRVVTWRSTTSGPTNDDRVWLFSLSLL